MWQTLKRWNFPCVWCAASLLMPVALQAATPATGQQRRFSESVAALQAVLQTVANPAARQRALEDRVAAITLPSDLRDALGLLEWAPTPEDQKARQQLAARLTKELRAFIRSSNPQIKLAAIHMIGEMGISIRATTADESFGSTLAADLRTLLTDPDPRIDSAAAEALGKVYPRQDPARAAAGFERLLQSGNVSVRRAGATGLAQMANTLLQLTKGTLSPEKIFLTPDKLNSDVNRIASTVIQAAARGLEDSDPEVRLHSLTAIRDAVATLFQVSTLAPIGELRPTASFLPVLQTLREKAPVIGRMLTDPHPDLRLLAAQALVDLAVLRRNLLYGSPRRPLTPPASRRPPGPGTRASLSMSHQIAASDSATAVRVAQETPLPRPHPVQSTSAGEALETLRRLFPNMRAALHDPSFEVRLQIIEALEMLGTDAAPFAMDLARAMDDPNLFVRWAAARTLGEMGPQPTNVKANAAAVEGLLKLVDCPGGDVDVRLAAATALERWGPDALDAAVDNGVAGRVIPVLSRAVLQGDPEVQVGFLETLRAMRSGSPDALRAVIRVLGAPDKRVRVAAAETLGVIGSDTPGVTDALTRALNDSDEDVRRAASDALLDIVQRSRR